MRVISSIAGVFFVVMSGASHASGWALFGKQGAMKNYVIVDVGEVSSVDPPVNTKWEQDVYQMNGRCFYFPGYVGYWGYGGKAAFLLVNAQKDVRVALFETAIGAVKVDFESAVLVECPAGTNVMPYSDDPEEQLKLLQKRQEELKKKLEQIQKQR